MIKKQFLKILGQNISRIRENAGLSQSELGKRCGKNRQSINRLEKGNINPSAYYLFELSAELTVPLKDLLDFQ